MQATCSSCGKDAPLFFRGPDRNRRMTAEVFAHYRCGDCGFVFISPVPPDLGRYYPTSYYPVPPTIEELDVAARPEAYKVETVRRHAASGRLLEIGPAQGHFAYLAKSAGYDVEAIEMDARCCAFLEGVVGVTAVRSDEPAAALADRGPYDVVALWQVIEHIPDPWTLLEAVVRVLRPGGVLVIATPNPQSLQFRMLGRFWPHVDAPRHTGLIPSTLLVKRLAPLGMKLASITTNDRGSVDCNMFGWGTLFSNMCSQRQVNWFLRQTGRAVFHLMRPFETVEGRGSSYTAVFRKG